MQAMKRETDREEAIDGTKENMIKLGYSLIW